MMLWITFFVFALAMLALGLGVFHPRSRVIHMGEAVVWTAVWIGLALLFNAGIFSYFGPKAGLEFFSAYLVEKALSVDSVFVFLLIFSYFNTAPRLQDKVLFWGIAGAIPHTDEDQYAEVGGRGSRTTGFQFFLVSAALALRSKTEWPTQRATR